MKLSRMVFVAWMVCAAGAFAVAQGQAPVRGGEHNTPSAAPGVAAGATGSQAAEREWVPDAVTVLGQKASVRREFRLEHSMLELASILSKENPELERVIAGVNGITVQSFGFPDGVKPDPAVLESIGQQYQAAGWMHLVSKHKNDSGQTTDLWLRMDETTVRDVAVLLVKPRRVDFVSASGTVSPLDLLHLSGHFGIPRMDSGIAVPVPQGKP